jgi:hypothetical protein
MALAWNGGDPVQVADTEDYELGVAYRTNGDITISHVRVWSGAGEEDIANRRARIWSSVGGQLAVVTLPDNLTPGWTLHALDTPLEVTSGTTIVVSYMTGGNYGALSGALDSDVPSADGLVTALSAANAPGGHNGRFNETPGSFPATGVGTHPFYGPDFQYTAGIGGNTAPRITDTSTTASGLTVTAAATVADDETLTGLTLRLKWGDGTSDTVVTYPTLSAQHTYSAAGIYPILFTATDASGASDNEADYVQVFAADSSVNTLNAKAMQQALASHAAKQGQFDSPVGLHEPRQRPASDLHAALWLNTITPIRASGLSVVSARIEWLFRIYTPGEQEPQDDIDATVLTATDRLFASLCGDFDLDDHLTDGLVRMIDIFGAHGTGLNATSGWARWSDGMSRIVTITIPVIVNDVWQEA